MPFLIPLVVPRFSLGTTLLVKSAGMARVVMNIQLTKKAFALALFTSAHAVQINHNFSSLAEIVQVPDLNSDRILAEVKAQGSSVHTLPHVPCQLEPYLD